MSSESCSSTSSVTGTDNSLSDVDGERKMVGTISFDTFTEFQHFQDHYDVLYHDSVISVPVNKFFPSPLKRQFEDTVPNSVDNASFDENSSVGLDLDDMSPPVKRPRTVSIYEGNVRAMEVTPDPIQSILRSTDYLSDVPHTPVPMVCHGNIRETHQITPVSVVRSGATEKVFFSATTFGPAATDSVCPCQLKELTTTASSVHVPTSETACISSVVLSEAEEWRDVLDFFCGPTALLTVNRASIPSHSTVSKDTTHSASNGLSLHLHRESSYTSINV